MLVFDPRELAKIPHRFRRPRGYGPGELAARAFEAFDTGQFLRQVVIELRQTPEQIEQLYSQWQELARTAGDEWTLTKGAREDLVKIVGEFRDIIELVERVRQRCPNDKPANDAADDGDDDESELARIAIANEHAAHAGAA